jgi:small multidrug resistance pump
MSDQTPAGTGVPGRSRAARTAWLVLLVAIVAEVIATSTLKSTEGFTRWWPSVVVVVCYELAFIGLSLSMKQIPVGLVYAVWSGVGVALVTGVAWLFLGQRLDAAGLAGVALIVGGVLVINLFSRSVVD